MSAEPGSRIDSQHWTKAEQEAVQLDKLNAVLANVQDRPFYRGRLNQVSLPLRSLEEIRQLPLIEKSDLLARGPGEPASIFELPRTDYTRFHQTSGTRGFPMPVLDTPSDWQWWLDCWHYVLDAASVTSRDVAMMAFSFGPFIGFWTANDALAQRGALVVPGGGLTSEARLTMIENLGCNVLCCTPTYALHLAAVAEKMSLELANSPIERIIVAGEPGGSIPAIRQRIEHAWGATVIDHCGASEIGAWGFGSSDGRGIHVIESEFIAECLRFDDAHPHGTPAAEGELAELVLTNLGRMGGPVIRYRTGDLVRGYRNHQQPSRFLWLEGGVIGRADNMLVVRGVNIFPSSVEAIVREFHASCEFRMVAYRQQEMDQLRLEIELPDHDAAKLADLLRDRLAMRIDVKAVQPNTLPRFEAKARRWIDQR